MSNYLTKEEIKQWRSSLEKMTLEEYAAKLGKTINTDKETNDIVDKVLPHTSLEHMSIEEYRPKVETIRTIAQKTILRERSLVEKYNVCIKNETKQETAKKSTVITDNEKFIKPVSDEVPAKEGDYKFKKNLTPREQTVFNYFLEHKNQITYAKDLADLLELPRDYIYKYIKSLRTKTETECIFNAENGGFILK